MDESGGASVIGWSWWLEVGKDKAKEDLKDMKISGRDMTRLQVEEDMPRF